MEIPQLWCRLLQRGAQENGHQVDVNKLRDKIEDDPSEPRYIQTVWGNRISVQDIRKESGYRT